LTNGATVAECKECAKPLWVGNKSGYCRHHAAQHMRGPEHAAKVSAGIQRKLAIDPIYREQCRQRAIKNCNSPKLREAARQAAIRSQAWRKATAAVTPEDYQRAVKRSAETKLGWCPAELRDEYRNLVNRKRYKAAEAKAIILDQHAKDMADFRRKLGVA